MEEEITICTLLRNNHMQVNCKREDQLKNIRGLGIEIWHYSFSALASVPEALVQIFNKRCF
jgi:hypothetical protein